MTIMRWIKRVRNRKLLNELSVKLPLNKENYGKDIKLTVGEGARFNKVSFHCRELKIGAYSYMHSGELYMVSKIGRYCSIAERVIIGVDPVGHPLDWLSTHPFQYSSKEPFANNTLSYKSEWQDVEIGNDVWIGQEVMIMKGVKIGNGAVIGARSIVTRDIPDYAIALGVPAKVIRYRFSSEIIKSLQKYPWWELPLEEIKPISFNNVGKSIEQLSRLDWIRAKFRQVKVVNKDKEIFFGI